MCWIEGKTLNSAAKWLKAVIMKLKLGMGFFLSIRLFVSSFAQYHWKNAIIDDVKKCKAKRLEFKLEMFFKSKYIQWCNDKQW